jgi:hypothetical protein
MSEKLERFFVGSQTDEKRYADVQERLGITPDGSFRFGLYGDVNAILQAYFDWKRSGYRDWPLGDGRKVSQPWWMLKNFTTLELIEEFFELRRKLKIDPKAVEVLPAPTDSGGLPGM